MEVHQDVWVVVLAAGDGTRLRSLTTDADGTIIPKQYCSFKSPQSMLQHTIARACRLVTLDRVVPIVADKHRQWWEPELAILNSENIVVQPKNRGTGIGILLPLLHVHMQNPDARIVVLPSDHYVTDEGLLKGSLLNALSAIRPKNEYIVSMGITAESADTEYGWIVPAANGSGDDNLRRVGSFVEKPPRDIAEELLERQALWNSFMLVGNVSAFFNLYERTCPELLRQFPKDLAPEKISALYETLPTLDFSHDLLEKNADYLRVYPVPACGWSDLGTPEKIVCLLHNQ